MNPGQPTPVDRDQQMLAHIGLYRLAFRITLDRLFFDGHSSANVVQRLLRQGRIIARPGLGARLRYYQLTAAETARQGVPLIRAKPMGAQAIQTHLGVLWFCHFTDPKAARARLEPDRLVQIFGNERPKGAHCIERGPPARVYRVIVTGERSTDEVLLKRLRVRVAKARRHPTLGPLLQKSEYCFVILAEHAVRRERLRKAIVRRGLDKHARITVDYAPSIRTVQTALKALQGRLPQ